MNENIDLTKILDGCPKGTKLYDTLYGEVSFEKIINLEEEYIDKWILEGRKNIFNGYFFSK